LMRRAAIALGIEPTLIRATERDQVPSAEPRPADTSLDTTRLIKLLPNFERPGVEAALVPRPAGDRQSSSS
jgi:hypothetical protein